MIQNHDLLSAACRSSLFLFCWKAFEVLYPGKEFFPAKHIRLLCITLEAMLKEPGASQLITMPPRYCKSFVVSICFAAWVMGKNPAMKVLVASYGDALAGEHAEAFRTLVESEWFHQMFPLFELSTSRPMDLKTSKGGFRKAISVGGAATGLGADLIIIDDIIKASDANSEIERERAKNYFDQTLFSRLDKKKNGHIVAIQQRFHEDDPAAYLAAKGFKHLCLRAIAEEREEWDLDGEVWVRERNDVLFPELEDLQTLEAMRVRITPAVFSAQYQQNPINPGGNQISWQSVQFYNPEIPREEYFKIVQSWDTACTDEPTSDYSVCATLGYHLSGRWHILDIHRERYSYADLERTALAMARRWRPSLILVECANTGYALFNKLKLQLLPARPNPDQILIWGITPHLGKRERFFVHKRWFEEGMVLLPETASWLADFRHEILAFPTGRYDDQIDAVIQILEFLDQPRGRAFMNRDPETGRHRNPSRSRRRAV